MLGDVTLSGMPTRGLYLAVSRVEFLNFDVVVDCPLPPKFCALLERENRLEKRRAAREGRSERTRVDEHTGETTFRFLDWYFVTGAALTPRQSSECVAEAAAELLQAAFRRRVKRAERRGRTVESAVRLLDLGTGCGNLMVGALLRAGVDAEGVGVELCDSALCVARRNIEELGVAHVARVIQGDFGRLREVVEDMQGGFDVVVSNPPYLTRREVEFEKGGLGREPEMALVAGGKDGMGAYETIAASLRRCPVLVMENGYVVLEVGGTRSAGRVREAFESVAGFRFVEVRLDERGFERCLILRKEGT